MKITYCPTIFKRNREIRNENEEITYQKHDASHEQCLEGDVHKCLSINKELSHHTHTFYLRCKRSKGMKIHCEVMKMS